MEHFCGQGFLTTDGSVWHQSRKMLKPTFAKANISELNYLSQETSAFQASLMGTGVRLMLGPLKSLVKFKDARQCAHAYIDFYVEKALEEGKLSASKETSSTSPLRCSLIHGLASQTDDIEYVRSQILQAMMASQETTAILIANTVFLLARHERHWQELRKTVLESGEDLFTYDRLHDFDYLQDIIKECKRKILHQEK
ncbi:hypothetical protein N0V90_004053 [Kalmusia sp. IMI 367209]|nr:hypothetical protein N0V90_004053 [Kalmusia sp. IMI 367209]